MSAKSRKHRAAPSLVDQATRQLEKGNVKQALKDARVAFRQAPTEETRRLLERAYIGRAQELLRFHDHASARPVIQGLLELGVTEPAVQAALPDVLIALGMLEHIPGQQQMSDAERRDMLNKTADFAVVRPDETPRSLPEIRAGAMAIRAALEAVERGDEPEMVTRLRDIPRSSPLADWKLFVRGLWAYYREVPAEMKANWDLLDPARFAARIAAPLKVLAGVAAAGPDDARLQSALRTLESAIASGRLSEQTLEIAQLVSEREWRRAAQSLRATRTGLLRLDATLADRLRDWFVSELMDTKNSGLFDDVIRLIDADPLDPHWNRARGKMAESSRHADEFRQYWLRYLQDVERISAWSEAERHIVQSLILLRLADASSEQADALRHCLCGRSHAEDVAELEQEAIQGLEQCARLTPAHIPVYESLANLHQLANRPEQVAIAYRRLLENVPDQPEPVVFLARYHLDNDEPLLAEPYAIRARQLKPLDKKMTALVLTTYLAAARHQALLGAWDEAHGALAAAEALRLEPQDELRVLAANVALETRAKNPERARQWIEHATDRIGETVSLWLHLTLEATWYELPLQEVGLYEKRWLKGLKRKCESETAGRMAALMLAAGEGACVPEKIADQVVEYLIRCKRVSWALEDLLSACRFLEKQAEWGPLEKLAKKGSATFPDVAYFPFALAMTEIEIGPRGRIPQARVQIERALSLAKNSTDADDVRISKMAKALLIKFEALDHAFDFDDDDDDDFDEDEYEDDLADADEEEDFDEDDLPESDFSAKTPQELLTVILAMAARMGVSPEVALKTLGLTEDPPPTGKARSAKSRK